MAVFDEFGVLLVRTNMMGKKVQAERIKVALDTKLGTIIQTKIETVDNQQYTAE
jgi:hypothetical protein